MSKPRWWPVALILALWCAGLVYVWSSEVSIRQEKILSSLSVTAMALVLAAIWLLFLSRLPWKARLGGVGLAALVLATGAATFRIRGVTGDLVPVLEPRWKAQSVLPSPTEVNTRAASTEAESFPQFQGPTRDGVLDGPALAADWSAHPPKLLWKREVGPAWAGFAIAGGRAYTQEQRGENETVTAYDLATGEPQWAYGEAARYSTTIGGVGPRSTPTLAAGRLYAVGGTGVLRCLDPERGTLLWKRDLIADHSAKPPDWGTSNSPLVLDGTVIVNVHGRAALAAYDAATGDLRWTAGSGPASYSSPTVLSLAGERQILSFNGMSVSGHDLASGEELWSFPWPSEQPNVAIPVALDEHRLFASSGYGVGGKLLEITHVAGGRWNARLIWETPRLKAKFANVIAYRGALFGLDDGVLVSLDPATGERHWKAGRYGHGQMLRIGERLLLLAEDGRVIVLDPDPSEHRELASFQALEGKTWNPPAIAGSILLVRNDREAAAYELARDR